MRIREGDPLEIFTNGDGGVVFKKYSLMGGLGDFSAQLCESLYKTTGKMVTITDRDACISVAGGGRRELTDKNISPALAQILEGRQIYQHPEGSPALPASDYTDHYVVSTAAPILSEGDVLGLSLIHIWLIEPLSPFTEAVTVTVSFSTSGVVPSLE